MSELAAISIVVPSFNQGRHIRETLTSLVAQDYPNLEVIVQDGGSTDGAVEIARDFAARYSQCFQIFSEKDRGQAHALNLGFAKTSGTILGFLNSDDTLYPGTLHRVASELDPALNRHIVMGRCLFTGEDSPYVGVEHPSEWNGLFDHLAIWNRGYNSVPQPSVFWTRDVWDRCGGFDEGRSHVLDYDLFCKFSQHYDFHRVDALWSTYRMHHLSKSAQRTEAEVLDLSIATGRKYWGHWWEPIRWRCEASYWRYTQHFHERARHHARKAEAAFADGRLGPAVVEFCRTAACSPRMTWQRLIVPRLSAAGLNAVERSALSRGSSEESFTGRHPDLWIGPRYLERRDLPTRAKKLKVVAEHLGPQGKLHEQFAVELRVDGSLLASHPISTPGKFALVAEVAEWAGKNCTIELRSSSSFVPRLATGGPDDRVLSLLLLEVSTTED